MTILFQKFNGLPPDNSDQFAYFDSFFDEDEDNALYNPDLVEARINYVKTLTVDMIERVEVVDTFEDDHEICIELHIYFTDGNILSLVAMWIIQDFAADIYAAAKYNIPEAKQAIIGYIQSKVAYHEILPKDEI